MPTARNVTTTPPRPPVAGHRPLLAGDAAAGYDTLLRRVSEEVKPAGVLEEIWLQDVVDLSWEVLRLRRQKADFLNSSAHRGLRKVLDGLIGWKEGQDLTAQWTAKNPEALKLVASSLAAAGWSMSTVMAQTLVAAIREVERLDRLTAAAALCRNAMLHEIAGHRAVLAARLQRATAKIAHAEIEDAEFKVIASPPVQPAGGAA